jgi:1,4-dihydroxy-2-naphthoate octaprenyltransferase
MNAFGLSLLVLAAPATSPAFATGGVDGVERPFLQRAGATTLLTGVAVVGAGVASSTASVIRAQRAAANDQQLDAARATYVDNPTRAHGAAVAAARKAAGTTAARAQAANVDVVLVLGGAVTMTIGWAVAAVGAIALVDGDDRAE